ncbi:MAG: TIGR00730 family Rossman fold protein, partial [Lachnospiraceae bacterium]|nr:TIGR00730 family Rossman fold protein [Candidatus Equihabitans merdae]
MQICVYGAANESIDRCYLEAGEELGRLMASKGHTMVFGGGASGLMGACARGIKEMNGHCIGIVPSFFNVDGV